MCAFQNQAHRRAAEVAERSILLIQSRHKRRSCDWIENAIPAYRQAGLREEDRGLLKVVEPITKVALRGGYLGLTNLLGIISAFLVWRPTSRQTKNAFSASPGASAVKILFGQASSQILLFGCLPFLDNFLRGVEHRMHG